jgi:hypothetical protein
LVRAIVTFVLAACLWRWQQTDAGEKKRKYAMVIHNDTQKAAHAWQDQVIELSQTGQWLKSIVQGHFNYYAVPGNTASLSLFRHRMLVLWWHSARHRSQKHRLSWTRMLDLATRWLPAPTVLHPYPDARFAATHPR